VYLKKIFRGHSPRTPRGEGGERKGREGKGREGKGGEGGQREGGEGRKGKEEGGEGLFIYLFKLTGYTEQKTASNTLPETKLTKTYMKTV
jgi:hypothetical protein